MIIADPRAGSREFITAIQSYGCEAAVSGIELASDFEWQGNGPDGLMQCGVERKSISDLLTSIRDRRLAGAQIGHMIRACPVRYLLVEGLWRRGQDGMVETGRTVNVSQTVSKIYGVYQSEVIRWQQARGSHNWEGIQHSLASICQQGGFLLIQTRDEGETAAWLAAEHDWWQKPWEAHMTSKSLYVPEVQRGAREAASGLWRGKKANVREAWLHALPGIGSKAVRLAENFRAPEDIAALSEKGWLALDGIGKVGAKTIWKSIHGEAE